MKDPDNADHRWREYVVDDVLVYPQGAVASPHLFPRSAEFRVVPELLDPGFDLGKVLGER